MRHLAFLAIAIVIFGTTPSHLIALDQRTIAERSDRIKNLSEVERDRLNRNLEEFKKLSESEKQRYRDLHAQLLEDGAKSGGLTLVMKTYFLWLQTLTPTQRDELAKETVPAQKLVLVRQFKEAQEHSSESAEHQEAHDNQAADAPHETHPAEPMHGLNPVFGPNVALSLKDLKAVMKVLVDRLPAEASKAELSDPKLSNYIPIIHASVRATGGNYKEWPDDSLLNQMVSSISKESAPVIKISDDKRRAIIRLTLLGILKQAIEAVPKPTADEKAAILESLTPDEKSRIFAQPSQRMESILTHKYLVSRGTEILKTYKDIPHYRDQLIDLFGRFEVPIPPKLARAKMTSRPGPRP